MAFLLLFLSSFFLKPALSAIVFEDEAPFLCEGNIPYNKAPIKWYYNKTALFCFAVRGGCESQKMPKTYDSIEECITKEFKTGFTKGGTARCYGQYFSNIPISFTYGSTKTKTPYLMANCYPEERVCPDGSGCFFEPNTAIATCCSTTQTGPNTLKVEYNKKYV